MLPQVEDQVGILAKPQCLLACCTGKLYSFESPSERSGKCALRLQSYCNRKLFYIKLL